MSITSNIKKQISERQHIEYENLALTNSLIQQHNLQLPFPKDFPEGQPIRSAEFSTQKAWRGKVKPIKGLFILASVATYENEVWYHVSFSHSKQMPTYTQVIFIRKKFFLPEMQVIQVFPEEKKHVNFHPFCLHLWSNLQRNILPDFSVENMI